MVAQHVVDALNHHAYSVRRKALYLIVQIWCTLIIYRIGLANVSCSDFAPKTLDAAEVLRNVCKAEKVTNATRINATTEFHACCNAVAKLDAEMCADAAANLVGEEPKLQAPLRILRNVQLLGSYIIDVKQRCIAVTDAHSRCRVDGEAYLETNAATRRNVQNECNERSKRCTQTRA